MNQLWNDKSAVTLSGDIVELRPLEEEHAAVLVHAASDGELWNSKFTVVPNAASIQTYIATALDGRRAGTVVPFVVVNRSSSTIVGTTRFWKIDLVNKQLEIGHTWLSRNAQRTGINTEAKYLLLRHAFETMAVIRVQFTTDELNASSRAAILRLGAKEEGVIRYERIMPDGRKRNSVRYSIIEDEWPTVKAALLDRMRHYGQDSQR